ncbi:MAG: phosphoribosylaminoimidazolesuccinocarboxamide synthase [Actinomycetia bacterium]|nr:phosphoribosylaminoimidazolesuccinocarboxamide synthase [Actinomycetes bacterium]
MEHPKTLVDLSLDLLDHRRGKVRDTYLLSEGKRLLITSDRISAFDRVIGSVPHKGQVLNQLSAWWFERTADVVANHVISVPDPNVTIAVDANPLPVEVVVRGRLTGSTSTSILPRYEAGERDMYGYTLPDGLEPHGALPEPLITPTTKATEGGHDEPISVAGVADTGLVEAGLWAEVQKAAMALFLRGTEVAAVAGFVLADTKYEFGLAPDGTLLLIDEVHTPDSSRFWAVDSLVERLEQGLSPESFDKEPVRLALRDLGYKGEGSPPELPAEAIDAASERYVALYERLTGLDFVPGTQPAGDRIKAMVAELGTP